MSLCIYVYMTSIFAHGLRWGWDSLDMTRHLYFFPKDMSTSATLKTSAKTSTTDPEAGALHLLIIIFWAIQIRSIGISIPKSPGVHGLIIEFASRDLWIVEVPLEIFH